MQIQSFFYGLHLYNFHEYETIFWDLKVLKKSEIEYAYRQIITVRTNLKVLKGHPVLFTCIQPL